LGDEEEGSEDFLSITGWRPETGIEGLPALISCTDVVAVVEKLIFCIGSNVKRFNNSISSTGRKMPLRFYY